MPSVKENLVACEAAYSRCFSSVWEDETRLRFRNPDIPDMYDHNYTYIKQSAADSVEDILRQEQAFCEAEALGFCKVSADFPLPDTLPGAELETLGYYVCTGRGNRVPTPACTIQKVSSLAMVDALYRMDIAAENGASVIYLTTDEDDTAKDMYLKRGFEKVGEKYSLLSRSS